MPPPEFTLLPLAWGALPQWPVDDHLAAFVAFQAGAAALLAGSAPALAIAPPLQAARTALLQAPATQQAARAFFEAHFAPHRVMPATGSGFVTGYFEPEVPASRVRTEQFPAPLYRRPAGLVPVEPGTVRGLDPALVFAVSENGAFAGHPDRAAIEAGALACKGLELCFVQSRAEAFFIQVQGSARLMLPDGTLLRVGYDGKSGHPYTGIGAGLIAEGEIPAAEMTAARLRHWLDSHPDRADAVMQRNRSFVFFREITGLAPDAGPVGAAGIPLHAGRSLAVDRTVWPYHTPVFVTSALPLPDGTAEDFSRLMIAHDTGSAIAGPARGDIFFGAGQAAFARASLARHPAEFTVLVPLEAVVP